MKIDLKSYKFYKITNVLKKLKKILAIYKWLWYSTKARNVQICVDAGGGRPKESGNFRGVCPFFKSGDKILRCFAACECETKALVSVPNCKVFLWQFGFYNGVKRNTRLCVK